MATSAVPDVKDKGAPKTAKSTANKERELTAQQQHHVEPEIAEVSHGTLKYHFQ